MDAVAFWRQCPRQIASDLERFWPRWCIEDWHRGGLSSFKLLELFGVTITDDHEAETRTITVDFAPEEGAVAAALRDGERPEWKQALAQVANISAMFRSAKMPNADTEVYGERMFFPASKVRQFIEDQQAIEAGVIMFPGEE